MSPTPQNSSDREKMTCKKWCTFCDSVIYHKLPNHINHECECHDLSIKVNEIKSHREVAEWLKLNGYERLGKALEMVIDKSGIEPTDSSIHEEKFLVTQYKDEPAKVTKYTTPSPSAEKCSNPNGNELCTNSKDTYHQWNMREVGNCHFCHWYPASPTIPSSGHMCGKNCGTCNPVIIPSPKSEANPFSLSAPETPGYKTTYASTHSPKSEVSGEWEKKTRGEWLKHCDDDSETIDGKMHGYSFVVFDEDAHKIADWWLSKLSSQRQSLEREHKEWKERIVKKIVDMRQDEHPTEDGVPVETHGYEETYNSALEQVKHLLLNEK